MTYLTIDEVAEDLGYTSEQVYKLVFEKKLFPSVCFESPVECACDPETTRQRKEPARLERLTGYFTLTGEYLFSGSFGLRWNDRGEAELADMFLLRDDKQYTLCEVKTVRKKDLRVSRHELDRYNKSIGWVGTVVQDHAQEKKCNLPDRSKGITIPPRKKAPITMILEYVFNACESTNPKILEAGNKDDFYRYIKHERTKETILPNGQSIAYYIENVSLVGTARGILMNHPKGGRKSNSKQDRWYSDADITERISRIRKQRKILK